MKINATIEARMGSSRFPGKVLKPINQTPILKLMIDRVKKSNYIDEVIVATTTHTKDEPIVEFCKEYEVKYFRGSEEDVLQRVLAAHKQYKSDVIVELTGDCPLIDHKIIDETIKFYLEHNYDYVSNCVERSYPDGMDTQLFSLKVLDEVSKKTSLARDREHVTPYIYLSGEYSFFTLKAPENLFWPTLGITLDTQEDFELIKTIFEHFNSIDFSLEEIIEYLRANPSLVQINSHIQRKGL